MRRRNQPPIDEIKTNFGKYMVLTLGKMRLTQINVVQALDRRVSPSTLSRMLRGECAPSLRDIEAIGAATGIPLNVLKAVWLLDKRAETMMKGFPFDAVETLLTNEHQMVRTSFDESSIEYQWMKQRHADIHAIEANYPVVVCGDVAIALVCDSPHLVLDSEPAWHNFVPQFV